MNSPGDLIDSLTLLIEHSNGVKEVDVGLFETADRWVVLRLGERVLSGQPRPVATERLRDALRLVEWPRLNNDKNSWPHDDIAK